MILGVCPQMHPVLSLRGAFLAMKQSPSLYKGIASAEKRLAMTGF